LIKGREGSIEDGIGGAVVVEGSRGESDKELDWGGSSGGRGSVSDSAGKTTGGSTIAGGEMISIEVLGGRGNEGERTSV
jgi:hypothetical protein